MKKIIFIIFLFLLSLYTSTQQWYQLYPDIDVGIYDVFCVDAYNVYFTTYSGPLIKTTDGGLSWQIIDDMNFSKAIYFINQDTGYVGGWCGDIYRTEDGGDTWITQNVDTFSYINIYEIKMISSDTIFVNTTSYNNNKIYRSYNGGTSWDLIFISENSCIIYMHILKNGTGFILEVADWPDFYSKIYKISDFGNYWEELATLEGWAHSIYFIDSITGYVGGNSYDWGTPIYQTLDGGYNWEMTDITDAHHITRFDFPDPSCGYFSGEYGWGEKDLPWGLVEMSEDEGNSWDEIYFTYYFMIHSLDFVSIDSGYIVGEGMFGWTDAFIMRTFDVEVSEKEIKHLGNPALSVSPNPFNKSTSINFELANPGNVELVIFDINNAIIKKFDLGFQEKAKGYLKLTLNNEPSGTYFCTLFFDGKPQRTIKIVKVE